MPTAVCYGSSIQSVVGQTGEWQQRAEFQFIAVGAQSLRVRLPVTRNGKEAQPGDLWAALIDGTPIEVRSVGDSYLVPIPLTGEPDAQRTLTLLYRTESKALKASGELKQTPPAVSVIHSSGTEQRLEVLSQSWQLHYPDDLLITASGGAFAPAEDLDTVSLLGDLRTQLLRIDRRALQQNGLVAFFMLVVTGAIAVALRRVSRNGRFGLASCGIAVATGLVCLVLVSVLCLESENAKDYARSGGMSKLAEPDAAVATTAAPASADLYFDSSEMAGLALRESDIEVQDSSDSEKPQPASQPAPAEDSPASELPEMILGAKPSPSGEPAQESDAAKKPDMTELEAAQQLERQIQGLNQLTGYPQSNELTVRRRFRSNVLRDKGGLLSLSLDLEVPDDSRSIELQYAGTRDAVDGVGLRLHWQDRQAGELGRVFLMLAVALVLWLMLGASLRTRVIFAVLCITLPLGLVSIAPDALHAVLDGVFLGGLLAVALWIARALLNLLRRFGLHEVLALPLRWAEKRMAGVLLLSLILSQAAVAAEPPVVAPPVPPVVPRTDVIVPFDPAQNPELADRVLLTREQFIDLWNLAKPDEKVTRQAPRDGVLADAFYQCELNSPDGASPRASVTATLILVSFREKPVTLSVPLSGVALSSAQLDGQPAALRANQADGRNSLEVVLPSRGLHTLDLKFDVPAQVSGQTGQFTVPVFPSPSGRVVFALPEDDLALRVNGSTSAYRKVAKTYRHSGFDRCVCWFRQPLTLPGDRRGSRAWSMRLSMSTRRRRGAA